MTIRVRPAPAFLRTALRAGIPALSLATAGCLSLPPPQIAQCTAASRAAIEISSDGRTASTTFDVLSYNIEGLGWPARKGRGSSLREIATHLDALRREGRAPDVVMLQEMFSRTAVRAMTHIGYANIVTGPARTQRRTLPSGDTMPRPYRLSKGEAGFHAVNGGLAIFSRFPLTHSRSEPYGVHRCAGYDCLSNKGMLFARMAIPGVPVSVDLYDTHMNSQKTSGVPTVRSDAAHGIQAGELAGFIGAIGSLAGPTILGGDFNMKDSPTRFGSFRIVSDRFTLVHEWCARQRLLCDVRMSWDGDAPWMDTHDLQLFGGQGAAILTPIRVQAMFDGSKGNPKLSDHDGLLVTYRLSWTRTDDVAGARCPHTGS